jgi:N4-gp56 family major capsid protein
MGRKIAVYFLIHLREFQIMATNQSSNFSSDVRNYLAEKVLPLAKRQLTAYQFADKLKLPENMGTTYTATRYSRLNLPFAPLSEGVPSVGEPMTISQAQGVAQQWGDSVTITDVAEITIAHDVFKQGIKLVAMQLSETMERNAYTGTNGIMAGSNVNYAGSVASRANLAATNVLSPHEINRAVNVLNISGAPRFGDPANEDYEENAKTKKSVVRPHYVAISHPSSIQDMRENTLVSTAWSYSAINNLYNMGLGEWGGVYFTESNMVPFWTGAAAVAITPSTTGGVLTTGNYIIQVTAAPSLTSMEQVIYQQSAATAVGTTTTGSFSVTLPTKAGYVFNVYISAVGSASVVNLGLSTSGPTNGPMAGQATQLASAATVVITGVGASQVPPAAPATGVSVYPTFVFGENAYGAVELDGAKFEYLKEADKSDRHNQLRLIAWKIFYGMIILNQAFMMRIESGSAFAPQYDSGAVAGVTY